MVDPNGFVVGSAPFPRETVVRWKLLYSSHRTFVDALMHVDGWLWSVAMECLDLCGTPDAVIAAYDKWVKAGNRDQEREGRTYSERFRDYLKERSKQ